MRIKRLQERHKKDLSLTALIQAVEFVFVSIRPTSADGRGAFDSGHAGQWQADGSMWTLQFKPLNRDGADGDGCEDAFCDWRVDFCPPGSHAEMRSNDVKNKGRKRRRRFDIARIIAL